MLSIKALLNNKPVLKLICCYTILLSSSYSFAHNYEQEISLNALWSSHFLEGLTHPLTDLTHLILIISGAIATRFLTTLVRPVQLAPAITVLVSLCYVTPHLLVILKTFSAASPMITSYSWFAIGMLCSTLALLFIAFKLVTLPLPYFLRKQINENSPAAHT